ncbi:MAG: hypothetical protein WC819_00730 [Parcubacteria group bacterium]|jgi:hypothetical protein
MKFKLVLIGKSWKDNVWGLTMVNALNDVKFNAVLADIFDACIEGANKMGPAELYRQDDDYGKHPRFPDRVAISICFSQAFDKDGRDWERFARSVVDHVKATLSDARNKMGGLTETHNVQLFFEGHVTNFSGASRFIEIGPMNMHV